MNAKLPVKIKKRYSINSEIRVLEESLKTMKPEDEGYERTVKALERLYAIRCQKSATKWKILIGVGGLGVTAASGLLAYKKDASDEIVRNKNTMNIFGKLFGGITKWL